MTRTIRWSGDDADQDVLNSLDTVDKETNIAILFHQWV